ncbi:MAG: hypothetical protein KME07_21390 [Pegethrix bostrychoides GSE-TBD4-15B]|jgi:hypothetical protein|uniref:Uncharacterized protein n=1 Tax=Pegethrix bostrychoides GSE-TBD4-15B TaxID=2839662 RepID=A0A951PFB5_9CYAN|nr:hypothetical protein [Pegethrix bostrychoides GSE-TBD4-15B]
MRPIGAKNKVWLYTAEAAAVLGISQRQLRFLREDLKFGFHYRVIGRTCAARPTYQWQPDRITDHLHTSPFLREPPPPRRRRRAAESD